MKKPHLKNLIKWYVLLCCLLTATTASASNSYGLPDNIQDGVILHCFDWSYNDIKAELPNIAKAGFVAVQTSPAQPNGSGTWYWLYQPTSFSIGTNGLGTKDELVALCTEAHKYGIKVVVDVVANHMNGSTSSVQSDLQADEYWHDYSGGIDYSNRWQITHGQIGMRDLNSEHSYVQQVVANYVAELKAAGVDGIRWDAAKHIGLPSEDCNFWPAVTAQGLWNYGEILVGPTNSGSEDLMIEYTNYINVTDDVIGGNALKAFQSGSVPSSTGNWCFRGVADENIVYVTETHDTYANSENDGGWSKYYDQNNVDRAYALFAAANGSTSLYLSRPTVTDKESIKIGDKGSTHFTSAEVAAVNHFHNALVGQASYYATSNNVASVCRKGGAVIVCGSGSGQVTAVNGGGYTTPGTYTDEISGNTFTVTSTEITGTVGSTGIAVFYDGSTKSDDDDDDDDDVTTTIPACATWVSNATFCYFEMPSTWSTVMVWPWNDDVNLYDSWPGSAADLTVVGTADNGHTVYLWTKPSDLQDPTNIIFNDGTGGIAGNDQTADLTFTNGAYYTLGGLVGVVTKTEDDEEIPTLTIDKTTGSYTDNVTVTLTASSSDATIVYTTDGTTPTASSTAVTGSATLTFSETTTLKAGILVNGTVYNVVTRTYTITKAESVYTPSVTDSEVSVFLETDGSTVTTWVWDSSNNYTGGTWPGQSMTYMGLTANGRKIYKWTYSGSLTTMPSSIIFVVDGTQTADLTFVNHGYYIDGTYNYTVEAEGEEEEEVIPTLTIDKEEGTYSESVTVKITASSDDATIVYTTDGTTPTASSTTATGSVTLTIEETTTLQAGILHDGKVYNVTSRTYTITKETEDVYTPTVTDGEVSVFLETDGSTITTWIWDSSNNYTGGTWPGQSMTYMGLTAEGRKVYKWTYSGDLTTMPSNIIFVVDGTQTADLTFVNHGYYIDGTYNYTVGADVEDVYTPSVTSSEKSVFLETDGSTITTWVWDDSNNYTGGTWPGQSMTYMGLNANGRKIYKWTYSGSLTTMPSSIIFVVDGTQTADLDYVNHGYYIDGTYKYTVEAEGEEEEEVIPTLTIDKEEGTYSESVTVKITASSDDATIVYTTDGTTPTASSTTATGSVTLTIKETTTLQAGILHDGKVYNVTSRTYTITKEAEDVYTPTVTDGEVSVFLETDGSTITTWIWDDSNNYTGGIWPGQSMTYMGLTAEGRKIYKWTYSGDLTTMPSNIIFVVDGTQTADLAYVNHGYYIDGTYDHTVGDTTPIEDVYTPSVTSSEVSVFLETDGSTITTWVWDDSNNYTGGTWPGQSMTYMGLTAEGRKIYKWTYSGDLTTMPSHIIFVVDGTQTVDLAYVNHGYYIDGNYSYTVASSLLGDVNMDGVVDISDVTTLIDYILGGAPSPFDVDASDVNQDGTTDISDVTGLIDMILSN